MSVGPPGSWQPKTASLGLPAGTCFRSCWTVWALPAPRLAAPPLAAATGAVARAAAAINVAPTISRRLIPTWVLTREPPRFRARDASLVGTCPSPTARSRSGSFPPAGRARPKAHHGPLTAAVNPARFARRCTTAPGMLTFILAGVTVPTAPLRILHAPANIANQAGYVASALRRLGHSVEVWDTVDRFGFPIDRVLDVASGAPAPQWAAFLEALDRFDILHFHFRKSLLMPGWTGLPPFWDLPVYRALGKRVFFTFHGSDVRTRRVHERINPWGLHRSSDVPTDDDRTEKELQVVRTYADRMFVVSVDLLPFVPDAEYVPRVIDLAEWPELPAPHHARPVVLHVASRPHTKGTPIIREGLQRLAGEGLDFELRVLEGVPHAEVRAAIAEADILVDNVIAGSYGISSMEAMASGRVALANLSEDVQAAHPDCPVVNGDPITFADVMRRLIADPDERARRAVAGRAFVARVHDAPVIAARLLEAYTAEPVRVRWAMPDWVAFNSRRRYEQLEATSARLRLDLAAARVRETSYRRRLGLPATDPGPSTARRLVRSVARVVLPRGLRRRLQRPPRHRAP